MQIGKRQPFFIIKNMSYYSERISKLNLKNTKIKLTRTFDNDNGSFFECDFIKSSDFGDIEIFPYNLKRELYSVEKAKTSTGQKYEAYKYTRYTPERTEQLGHKSNFPKGLTPPPFIPLNIIESFEKETEIKTLIITEGYIKAIKGANEGLNIIGLPSITIYKEKETGVLFEDIYRIIDVCKIKNVILLYDADCLDISEKDLSENLELTKRPKAFYNSAINIRDFLVSESDVKVYFAKVGKKEYKGLDDILIKFPESVSIFESTKILDSIFCQKVNITRNDKTLKKLLKIDTLDSFFLQHQEKLKCIEFLFYGNKYKYENEKIKRLYEEIKYFRVGDDFFEVLQKLDKNNNPKTVYDFRKRQTIIDDNGEGIIKQMPKYNAFCNVPDNSIEYKRLHYNSFNVFSPSDHIPKIGTFPTIDKLIKHIFGKDDFEILHPISNDIQKYNQYEIGLDYIQLLWTNPIQILPILGIVSICRQTGKTTFMNFLNDIFGENSIIIFMSELESDFNSTYANKILIMADETRLENKYSLEKIKSLSTAKRININFKFSQKHTVNFYGKIILSSNHEEDFISTSEDEIRFWVRKINKIDFFDKDFEKKLKNEIPAFLYFLQNRELSTKNESRMHFLPEIIFTAALKKVIENSKSGLYKNLHIFFSDFFANNNKNFIYVSSTDIKSRWFQNESNISSHYIGKVLRDEFKIEKQSQMRYSAWEEQMEKNGFPYKIESSFFNINNNNEIPF